MIGPLNLKELREETYGREEIAHMKTITTTIFSFIRC